MIRFLVLDLDGTLVDSRRDLADAANELLAGFGAPPLPTGDVVSMVGEGARLLVSRVLAARRVDTDVDAALSRFLDLYDRRLADHTRPYPGVVETLERLAGRMALAVLTNKPQAPTIRLLDALDLTRFFVRAIGGDTPLGRKPAPEGLASLCRHAGVAPAQTLMVGDTWVDVQTARHAGTRACFADYGFGRPPEAGLAPGEIRIARFSDLLDVVGGARATAGSEPG
jgi:phosphoglycolate phosphatase